MKVRIEGEVQVYFNMFTSTVRERDLVVCVVAVDEVLHYRARFEKSDGFAICEGVCEGWNAAWRKSLSVCAMGTVVMFV